MVKRLLAMALLGLSVTNLAAAERAPALPDYPAKKVAPHTYVIHGPIGYPSPENQGFMNNPGFVITQYVGWAQSAHADNHQRNS